MKHTNTVIIGGGQAGLAMSHCLMAGGIDNVILERGRIAERWRSERWDSLRLLSPNWMARLPGYRYEGDEPDSFMTMPQFTRYLEAYASSFEAPVQSNTTVTSVERTDTGGFRVITDQGEWRALNVVVATGFCDIPRVPAMAAHLSPKIRQVTAPEYRNPEGITPGNVLVVGASATGLQIADELRRAGREVTIAIGTHVRLPRRYRGKDILHWMVEIGAFEATADPASERLSPPPQLVGTVDNRNLDLATLQDSGVRLAGRVIDCDAHTVRFADDLAKTVAAADQGMQGLLQKIDAYIESKSLPAPPAVDTISHADVGAALQHLDLTKSKIRTVIWATGYERRYPWLTLPVLDDRGEIRHEGGVTPEEGLFVMGMRFQRTRGSNLIDGVAADAEAIATHLANRSSALHAA